MTAEEVISALDLEPLEGEGGYFRFKAPFFSPAGERAGGSILYLMTDSSWSSLHWLPTGESWHYHAGDPVEQLLLFPDGTWTVSILGTDFSAGQRPLVMVPGGVWQGSRPLPVVKEHQKRCGWSLCSTVMVPPFDAQQYIQGKGNLMDQYPDCSQVEDFLAAWET